MSPKKLFTTLLFYWERKAHLVTSYEKQVDVAALVASGVLHFDRMIETDICCKYCGERNDVSWEEFRDVPTCMFHCCDPECRSNYVVDLETIKGWKVTESVFLTTLVETLGIKEKITEVTPDQIWKLGRRNRREYFFLRSVGNDSIRSIMSMFSNQPKAVLVTTRQYGHEILSRFMTNPCFSLEDVGTFDEKFRPVFDLELIQQYVPSFSDDDRKKTAPKRASRASGIEVLTDIMKDHARAVCEHADFSGRNGRFEFIPRPTQMKLAEMAGIPQPKVFRCLSDPSAVVLRLLWENSETERGIEVLRRFV